MTLKNVMRPENGSVIVLKTSSAAGSRIVHFARQRHSNRAPIAPPPFAATACSAAAFTGNRRALHRRRRIHLDEVEQMIGRPYSLCAARKQHREDAVLANRLMQRGNQMLLGNRALGEVLLHQLVFALGHQLHQRLMRALAAAVKRCRNLADLAAAIAAGRVVERLHRHQVDDAMKSLRIR